VGGSEQSPEVEEEEVGTEAETEAEEGAEVEVEAEGSAPAKKVRKRGESKVPRCEPATAEERALIRPSDRGE